MTDRLNGLGRLIGKAGGHLSADSPAKRLFSNKQVLGRLAKACLPEYHDLPLETVVRECFDDDYSLQEKRHGASSRRIRQRHWNRADPAAGRRIASGSSVQCMDTRAGIPKTSAVYQYRNTERRKKILKGLLDVV